MKKIIFMLAMFIMCITFACGGGFGADCDDADDVAPGFFGPDSLRY